MNERRSDDENGKDGKTKGGSRPLTLGLQEPPAAFLSRAVKRRPLVSLRPFFLLIVPSQYLPSVCQTLLLNHIQLCLTL